MPVLHHENRSGDGDETLVDHVARDLDRGGADSLTSAALEDPELVGLDRELDVHDVPEVVFEPVAPVDQSLVAARELGDELIDVRRGSNARHHVFALGVDEVLAVELLRTGGRVPREEDAGAGVIVAVAENHL